ncbi:MAG: diacylglycerol kinase family protein [Leptolyngbya sp. SIO3F4]|nr:diacylglycerol kinase family protein [Leptolyngbya sp. SIO3F4]
MSISSNLQTVSKSKKESKTAWQVAPNLFTSFRYAWAGITYAIKTQRNFRIHLAIGLVALILGILLHIHLVEAAIISVTISIVLVMELMNTALESVVDLTVGQTYHELAKIAKDCAAGAVLISAIAALIVAAFIYLPPLLLLLRSGIA